MPYGRNPFECVDQPSAFATGVLFVGIGFKYAQECLRGVQSIRQNDADLPVIVFTDHPEIFVHCVVETRTLEGASGRFGDKILAMSASPFEHTLFSDADTVVLEPICALFDLLLGFDIAVAVESYTPDAAPGLPCEFPEFNTGVILYRCSAVTEGFFGTWREVYDRQMQGPNPPKHDQPSFREALFLSTLRFSPISPRWNFRTCHPSVLEAGSTVAILHSRSRFRNLSKHLRERGGESRVFIPDVNALKPSRIRVLQPFGHALLESLCWPIRAICVLQKGLRRFFNIRTCPR